jgi:hypothetical protein
MNISKQSRSFLQDKVSPFWIPEEAGEDPMLMHLTRADDAQTGGIDFNANNMNVQTTGSGIHFDAPSVGEAVGPGGLEDLSPVILSVTPLESSRVFLSTP